MERNASKGKMPENYVQRPITARILEKKSNLLFAIKKETLLQKETGVKQVMRSIEILANSTHSNTLKLIWQLGLEKRETFNV